MKSDFAVPPEACNAYYDLLFPAHTVFSWLDLQKESGLNIPNNREYAVQHFDGNFRRFKEFNSPDNLRTFLKSSNIASCHVGGVYEKSLEMPSQHNHVMYREYILDIDISDYDLLRTCDCERKQFCSHCWKYVATAVDGLNLIFDLSLGYRKYQWFFSGQRGVHCWVRDTNALKMSQHMRTLLTKFIAYPKKYTGTPYYQLYDQVIKPVFYDFCLKDSEIFLNPFTRQMAADYLPQYLRNNFYEQPETSLNFFEDWCIQLEDCYMRSRAKELKRQLMFKVLYPRIDYNVSCAPEHLIRCPFTVHPSSGRIVVPINHNAAQSIPEELQNYDVHNLHSAAILQYARILDPSNDISIR